MNKTWILMAGVAALAVGISVAVAKAPLSSEEVSKKKVKYADVQAIFTANCIRCHGEERPRGGIKLVSYEDVMKGGEDGVVVIPKDLKKSLVYLAITAAPAIRPMPPRGPKLADKDIKTIETWIKEGAKK